MKKTLWKHDFVIITWGTLISAIGNTAMNFALSLVVFDNTASTMLTGLFTAITLIPAFILPIIAGPLIDRMERKKIIVGIDSFNAILYLSFGIFLKMNEFSYIAYVLFSFVISSTGALYSLAYSSLYPDLIPNGFAQKGYSVSSMIYPSVTALFTPIASIVYIHYGTEMICFIEGVLLIAASIFESRIRYKESSDRCKEGMTLSTYKKDMLEGFHYLKKEAGIRQIYTYMAVTNGTGNAVLMMSMALFQTSPIFTTTMYAFLTTADTIGRMLGGILHYFIRIPYKRRFNIAISVYGIYQVLDASLLFLSYPLMIVNRFLGGFLGINSLNIREACIQNYIPANMRARINGFFNVIISFMLMIVNLLVGVLGEYFSYRSITLSISLLCMFLIYVLLVRHKKEVKPIFNQNI